MSSAYLNMLKSYNNKSSVSQTATPTLNTSSSFKPPTKDTICDKLESIWRQRQSFGVDSTETGTIHTQVPQKLGILMIIIDDLPHEAIWRVWSEIQQESLPNKQRATCPSSSSRSVKDSPPTTKPVTSTSNASFFIHAKYRDGIKSDWVCKRLVEGFQLQPGWGSVTLTEVMIRLLHEAITSDPSITSFCFVSETCIPIRPLPDVFKLLKTASINGSSNSSSNSWLKYTFEADNGYAKQKQFDALLGKIPAQCVAKSDQWMLLSRQHALDILALNDQVYDTTAQTYGIATNSSVANVDANIISTSISSSTSIVSKKTAKSPPSLSFLLKSQFSKVNASDEMYFASCLSILGYIQNSNYRIDNSVNINDTGATASTFSTQELTFSRTNGSNSNNSTGLSPSSSSSTTHHRSQSQRAVVLPRRMTYSVWVNIGDRSPKTFTLLIGENNENHIQAALKEGCLFFRKLIVTSSAIDVNRIGCSSNRDDSNTRVVNTGFIHLISLHKESTARLSLFEEWLEAVMNIYKPALVDDANSCNSVKEKEAHNTTTATSTSGAVNDVSHMSEEKRAQQQQQQQQKVDKDDEYRLSLYTYYMARAKELIEGALHIRSSISGNNCDSSHNKAFQSKSISSVTAAVNTAATVSNITSNNTYTSPVDVTSGRIQKRQKVEE